MSELFFARPFQLGFLSTKVGLFRLLLPSGFGRITASQREDKMNQTLGHKN